MGYCWLEPCAVKVVRTVLRRGGRSNPFFLFDYNEMWGCDIIPLEQEERYPRMVQSEDKQRFRRECELTDTDDKTCGHMIP